MASDRRRRWAVRAASCRADDGSDEESFGGCAAADTAAVAANATSESEASEG